MRDGRGCRSSVHDEMVIGSTVIDHTSIMGDNIIKTNLSQDHRSQRGEVAGVTTVCGLCGGKGWMAEDGTSHVSVQFRAKACA